MARPPTRAFQPLAHAQEASGSLMDVSLPNKPLQLPLLHRPEELHSLASTEILNAQERQHTEYRRRGTSQDVTSVSRMMHPRRAVPAIAFASPCAQRKKLFFTGTVTRKLRRIRLSHHLVAALRGRWDARLCGHCCCPFQQSPRYACAPRVRRNFCSSLYLTRWISADETACAAANSATGLGGPINQAHQRRTHV